MDKIFIFLLGGLCGFIFVIILFALVDRLKGGDK